MLIGLHTGSIMYTNLVTDIRIAGETGYDAIEITVPKLLRYLDAGYQPEELLPGLGSLEVPRDPSGQARDRLGTGSLRVGMINSFLHIERQDVNFRQELLEQCERICVVASALSCPMLQVVALNALDHETWPAMRTKVGRSLAELADIAQPHGVRLALEPVSFTQMGTIDRAMEVLDVAGRDNAGLCLDTFHLWTGGTSWDRVAGLDPTLIHAAHISDVLPRQGDEWADADRDVLPGDGILPLKDGIDAIKATGFDGLWSVEMLGAYHWEWDPEILARELRQRASTLLAD